MTADEFFARYTDQSGGPDACWPFMGHRDKRGYGGVDYDGKWWLAHRLAWTLAHGPLPPPPPGASSHGTCVLHHCDNPPCCNPFGDGHLFLGTQRDNMHDMHAKGRYRGFADPRIPDDIRAQIVEMKRNEPLLGDKWIARQFDISEWTVRRILREAAIR